MAIREEISKMVPGRGNYASSTKEITGQCYYQYSINFLIPQISSFNNTFTCPVTLFSFTSCILGDSSQSASRTRGKRGKRWSGRWWGWNSTNHQGWSGWRGRTLHRRRTRSVSWRRASNTHKLYFKFNKTNCFHTHK